MEAVRSRLRGMFLLIFAAVSILGVLISSAGPAVAKKGGGGPKPPPSEANPVIAYVSTGAKGKPGGLRVMNANGSNQTMVYQGTVYGRPSWSLNGKHIAFTNGDLWRIDIDVVDGEPQGSNATCLVETPWITDPAWSPLNDRIAFVAEDENVAPDSLQVVPIGGGTAVTLYTAPTLGEIDCPTWSPDGLKIAFVQGTPSGWTIEVYDTVSQTVTTVGPASGIGSLDWARTGNTLIGDDGSSIYTVDVSNGEATEVCNGMWASWSPDDKKIVFFANGRGKSNTGLQTHEFATGLTEKLASGGKLPTWRR